MIFLKIFLDIPEIVIFYLKEVTSNVLVFTFIHFKIIKAL